MKLARQLHPDMSLPTVLVQSWVRPKISDYAMDKFASRVEKTPPSIIPEHGLSNAAMATSSPVNNIPTSQLAAAGYNNVPRVDAAADGTLSAITQQAVEYNDMTNNTPPATSAPAGIVLGQVPVAQTLANTPASSLSQPAIVAVPNGHQTLDRSIANDSQPLDGPAAQVSRPVHEPTLKPVAIAPRPNSRTAVLPRTSLPDNHFAAPLAVSPTPNQVPMPSQIASHQDVAQTRSLPHSHSLQRQPSHVQQASTHSQRQPSQIRQDSIPSQSSTPSLAKSTELYRQLSRRRPDPSGPAGQPESPMIQHSFGQPSPSQLPNLQHSSNTRPPAQSTQPTRQNSATTHVNTVTPSPSAPSFGNKQVAELVVKGLRRAWQRTLTRVRPSFPLFQRHLMFNHHSSRRYMRHGKRLLTRPLWKRSLDWKYRVSPILVQRVRRVAL